MLAKTHVAFGILAGLITLKYTSVQNELLFIALVILGVFLPDIDHPESKVNNSLKITKVIPIIFGHRGFFHSIFAVILVFAGLWWWQGFIYGFGVSIGYLSHLVSDALTLSGVGFLNPIAHYKVRGPVQTGTLMETLLFFVVIALDVLLLVH
ncbi:MAG: metal-dependent hydrolase [Candidatus Woesearchaeota archaeon]